MEAQTVHSHKDIYKAVIRSQHCQRNWDLTKEIPEEDIKLLMECATQCPSKQNIAFYNLHLITDRTMIEEIHSNTWGITTKRHPSGLETNTQTLANLVIVFELTDISQQLKNDTVSRNDQSRNILNDSPTKDQDMALLKRDADVAVGVAAGYLNLTASLLGYSTGCCQCFDIPAVKKLMCLKNEPTLIMGIGYKNDNINRRRHHIREDFVFSIKKKQPIDVTIW